MPNIPIISFNNGEVSPKIDARGDIEKYQASCRYLRNMLPLIYGCAERRPGFGYIDDATNTPLSVANTSVRMVPFIFSSTISYMMEFGNKYIKFYYDGAALDDSGDVWIVTPYIAADLFELQFRQIGDVVRITHKNYFPRILTRTGVKTFTLEKIPFRKGPFLTRNDLIDPANPSTTTLASNVTAKGATGELTASTSVFLPGHVGALFKLVHPREETEITQKGAGTSDSLKVKGTAHFKTMNRWKGTVIFQRNENEGGWENWRKYTGIKVGDRNDSLAWTEEEDNVEYRIYAEPGMTNNFAATLSTNEPNMGGIVKITAVINQYRAAIEVYSEIESTDATKKWYEGAWSEARGYPSAIAFNKNRCIYGGASIPLADSEYSTSLYPALRI